MLLEKLTDVMKSVFKLDELVVTRETTARDIEQWDSLAHINLIMSIEHAFKVRFSNSEIAGFEKLGDIIDRLEESQ